MNYHENNRVLIEKTLQGCIKNMCFRLRLGFADWDIDSQLRKAIESHSQFNSVADLVKTYDETLALGEKACVNVESKYLALKKLTSK